MVFIFLMERENNKKKQKRNPLILTELTQAFGTKGGKAVRVKCEQQRPEIKDINGR